MSAKPVDTSYNVKATTGMATAPMAIMLHAIYGLGMRVWRTSHASMLQLDRFPVAARCADHFPGYLMRWPQEQVQHLLAHYEHQVQATKAALAQMIVRDAVLSGFRLDAALASAAMTNAAIDERIFSILTAPKLSHSKLRVCIDEVVPGVFAFPLLKASFAQRILEETQRFTAFRSTLADSERQAILQVPGSANVTLDSIGACICVETVTT